MMNKEVGSDVFSEDVNHFFFSSLSLVARLNDRKMEPTTPCCLVLPPSEARPRPRALPSSSVAAAAAADGPP